MYVNNIIIRYKSYKFNENTIKNLNLRMTPIDTVVESAYDLDDFNSAYALDFMGNLWTLT